MPTAIIRTSFTVITHESAAEGDAAEHGWEDEEGTAYSFREAVALLRGTEPSSSHYCRGTWYTAYDHDGDMRTGDRTDRSFHVDASEGFQRRLFAAIKA